MLNLLQRLKARKAESEITLRDQWLGLVQAVADDDEPDDDNLLATLDDCGKSLDELEAAVALVKQRCEWAAQIEAVPAAKVEIQMIEAERKAATDEINIAIRKHNDRIKVFPLQEQQAISVMQVADLARQRLSETCTDESLKSRIVAARDAIRKIYDPLNKMIERRGSRRAELGRLERANSKPELLATAQIQAAEFDHEIARLESETRQLQAEIDVLHGEALDVMAI